jgi:hypothetical protein
VDRTFARVTRWTVALISLVAFMAATSTAQAAITNVFSSTPAPIPCAVQGSGVRLCDQTIAGNPGGTARSTVKTFDGVPIDVRVAFPPQPPSGPDGPYPLIMLFHGYAGSKLALATMQPFLDAGYATFSMTTRGFGQTCGTSAARSADPTGCASGWVRLMDTRYEVRDAQELAGLLADEGRTSHTQVGAIGGSYGGGLSMSLAALKNRKMLPGGSLVPWQSPNGTPMQIAAAAPEIPWTDLPYSLVPNGRTLDYVADAPYVGRSGVLKQSWENGLYNSGFFSGFYAPAGADPDADLVNWHNTFNNGEPYDDASGNPLPAIADIRDELTTHHSSYYIDHSQAPSPVLISNGFTDDLFPVDETLRYYNRTRAQYPGADISLFFASLGHQRGQNKAGDLAARSAAELAWLNYYVRGIGSVPFHGVTTYTQTCPNAAAAGGPYVASTWAELAPGEIRFDSSVPKTILPTAGSTTIAATFDPLTGPGACGTNSATDQANTATYRMAPVPAGGFTLMGSPTVIAEITSAGSDSQIAARLLDVDPGTGNQTLVARGLWRPAISGTPVRQVFQTHPAGYMFAAGHVVKLELLPNDANTAATNSYGRSSNNQQNVTIENLELRLPTIEQPGALGGLVQTPQPKVVPGGYALAPGYDVGAFDHPGAATLLDVSLVPAFRQTISNAQCSSRGGQPSTHGSPLALASCNPPGYVAGTAARQGSLSDSSAALTALPGNPSTVGDEADLGIALDLNDVRDRQTGGDYVPNGAGPDVTLVAKLRLSDSNNGPDPATLIDFDYSVGAECVGTADPVAGSTCSLATTADSLVPGTIVEGKRTVLQTFRIRVNDSGTNGVPGGGDDRVFAQQGIYERNQ